MNFRLSATPSVGIAPTFTSQNIKRGVCMDSENLKSVTSFIQEFLVHSLLPFMDRNVQVWNEQVASSRKGLTSRLFSAGRKYFGGTSTKTENKMVVMDGTSL